MQTKALISCKATVQLFCAFVFAFAKNRFSHDGAHLFCHNAANFPVHLVSEAPKV